MRWYENITGPGGRWLRFFYNSDLGQITYYPFLYVKSSQGYIASLTTMWFTFSLHKNIPVCQSQHNL